MNAVAFVFARGGSKGLPGKNTRLFGGKPLIAWSIELALEINRFDRVIVSTDSEEIAYVSKEYGAEVPFMRPAELATDTSPEWDSWKHALRYLEETSRTMPEIMVSIPPVAPLRSAIDIENCLDEYTKGFSDIVITVADAHRSPYFNMVKTNLDGSFGLVDPSFSTINRRQDVPIVFDMATVCYVANSEFVMSHNSIFQGQVGAVLVPSERAIDIDTYLDFQIAEYLLTQREQKIDHIN